MPDTEIMETTAAQADEEPQEAQIRLGSPSLRAAAVEAAYILEAVRR